MPTTRVFLLSCFFASAASIVTPLRADPLPQHADIVIDYRITVQLDAIKHRLEGKQRLVWRNPSNDAVGDLWFHLYLNAFKNSLSTFFRESGGQLRGDRMPEDGWGWIDVTKMTLADGTDLRPSLRFEHPDDDNKNDQTVARVVLPQPVPPGGSLTLEIAFTAQLPRVFARTGYKDDFHLVGQWFPKIAVYEPAGTRGRTAGGWNAHQFHANSEFYADFGRYDVEITVPSRFVVGATGRRVSERTSGGNTTYRYTATDVHDFAWTADPAYLDMRRTFSATRDVTPEEYARTARKLGRSLDEMRLKDVEIILLLQPSHRPQAERHFKAAVVSLAWFGLLYGRYPYDTLTIVDPAPGAGGAGGMEYPTFITAGTSFLSNRWPLSGMKEVEGVTIHEFGHQYWYGLVANNEFEEAWLDEGFNSYSTAKVTEIGYGTEGNLMDVLGLRISEAQVERAVNTSMRMFDRVRQPAWTYHGGMYAFYSYMKPALLLRTLENYLGEDVMARVMRTYHERWRFRHPSSDDFYAVANEVSGKDLSWYFRQAAEGTEVLDYEVASATSTLVKETRGVMDTAGGRNTITDREARDKERAAEKAPDKTYETTVVVRRRGDFVFPVEIGFKFEGRPMERVTWDGRERWKRYQFTRARRLLWADVDPFRKIPLDVNWMNNGRLVEPDRRQATSWAATFLFLLQNALAVVGW